MSSIIDTVGSKSGIVGSDVYPAGHILQFGRGTVNTLNRTTTNSPMEIFSSNAEITPQITGSRIIIIVHIASLSTAAVNSTIRINLTDGAGTILHTLAYHFLYTMYDAASGNDPLRLHLHQIIDGGVSTTNGTMIPYNVEFFNNNGTTNVEANRDAGSGGPSSIFLMEVAQ
jgi:hypothetical protein